MQASMPANVEALPSAQAAPANDYAPALDKLLQLYTEIDKVAVALPFVSIPLFSVENLRQARKRLNPLTAWKVLWTSLQSGELWSPPWFSLRPLVLAILHWHFRSRLAALRQH